MRVFAILLSLTLFVTGCRGPASGDSARGTSSSLELAVELPSDATVGPATVTVRVLRDGAPFSDAEVEVTGDMTHAGMVPVVATAREAEPGVYRTADFAFDMAGDWIVSAEATAPDGEEGRAEAATTVRRP